MAEALNKKGQMVLATGGYDHAIKLWQPHTGICLKTLQHDSHCNSLEVTPDGQLLAAGGFQHIRMYDLNSASLNPVVSYDGIEKNVTEVGFQEDGKWMFTGGEKGDARIWDLRSRNLQCQRIFQVKIPVLCVCLHPNQTDLIVGDQSGVIHLWDLKTDHNEQLIPETEESASNKSIQSVDIDPQGNYLAAITGGGNCFIWSLSGGVKEEPTKLTPKQRLKPHEKYGLCVKFSPDSKYLATSSADQSVRIYRTSDFALVQVLKRDNQRWVWDIAFSADSQYVITASTDSVAKLWSIDTGLVQREYQGHVRGLTAVAFRDQTTPPDSL